jgi:predicted glycosyltransferase
MAAEQMRQSTARPRVLFYVQHLLGIGHLARASRIARALTQDGFDVTMVTGGMPVPGFPGPNINHVALPANSKPSAVTSCLSHFGMSSPISSSSRHFLLDGGKFASN